MHTARTRSNVRAFKTLTTLSVNHVELWPGSIKVGRLHKGKNNVISGFIRSLVLNTSTPRDGWSGTLQSSLLYANDCNFVV